MDKTREKVEKIYSKINAIALKGVEGLVEYKSFIDQCVRNGEYTFLELCLNTKYNINLSTYNTAKKVKDNTFNKIRLLTKPNFTDKLIPVLKKYDVYQVGNEIRSNSKKYIGITSSVALDKYYNEFVGQLPMSIELTNNTIYITFTDANIRTIEILNSDKKTIQNINRIETPFNYTVATNSNWNLQIDDVRENWETNMNVDIKSSYNSFESVINSVKYDYNNKKTNIILNQVSATQSSGSGIIYNKGNGTLRYRTNISTNNGGDYVVKVIMKNSINVNYKVNINIDNLLGYIFEIDKYKSDEYYILQKEIAKILKNKKVFLEVKKVGEQLPVIINIDKRGLTSTMNLINRYDLALLYLTK